ncbi:ABC transporter ATP-binding protein [Hypericibacter sp.]|uniref:ABC transporter ATP-binding protein n=1 Tax=Hypericibacter sp. TaxID=2705401 RepID=UPI003D6D6984
MLLELAQVEVAYRQSLICQGVSLAVDRKEVVCLLGRNGVGKTTLMRSLMGILPNRAGKILFDGQDMTHLPSHERARRGMAYVPQGRLVFPQLTVAENLRSGTLIGEAAARKRAGFGPVDESVFGYFPILRERLGQRAGTLSGGEQQMLALGRALAANPRLLLLDEPSEGIQPSIVQQIRDIIARIAVERNLAVLLVEQNLKFATGASTRGYVMDKGQIVAEGSVAELAKDAVVSQHLTFVEEKRQTV